MSQRWVQVDHIQAGTGWMSRYDTKQRRYIAEREGLALGHRDPDALIARVRRLEDAELALLVHEQSVQPSRPELRDSFEHRVLTAVAAARLICVRDLATQLHCTSYELWPTLRVLGRRKYVVATTEGEVCFVGGL